MSRALRELGLGPDADERAVKRAYATRLKTTRPDTDPEGFQALNAAYHAALAWVQSQATAAANTIPITSGMDADSDIDTDEDESPPGSITRIFSQDALFDLLNADEQISHDREEAFDHTLRSDQSMHASAIADEDRGADTERFDLDAFFNDCTALAVRSRDGELLDWLNAQPILWSLQHKAQIARWLLGHLHEQRPAIEARRFDELADFFGLLDLNSDYDAYVIQRLRHRLHLAWEVQTVQLRALAQRAAMDGASTAADLRQTQRVLGQLCRPANTAQALFAGLMPMYPSAVRRFLYRLDFGNLDDLPAPINPEQIAFWEAAGDRTRISRPRLQIGAARCVVYSALAVLIVILVKLLAPEAQLQTSVAVKTGATVFAAMLTGWLGLIGGQLCLDWQCLPEDETLPFYWSRWALIPFIAAVAVALDVSLHWDSIATALSMAACLLAWHRYRRRNGPLFNFTPRRPIWYAIGFVLAFSVVLALLDRAPHALVGSLCGLALALWAMDLRKQRAVPES